MSSSQSDIVARLESDPATFRARRGLRGGHRQTIAAFLLPRRISLSPPEERLVEVEAGVKVLCHCHWQNDRENALTVLAIHGLEGSSESQYVMGLAHKALAAGMNVVRMNQRNCGGTDALAPVLYHSGLSTDVAAVTADLLRRDRVSELALVGFSMGGNLVLKLAGDWGREAPAQLRAVATVCPSMDLAASADALHDPANRLYEYYFLWKLRRRLRAKAKLFPGHFDLSRLRGLQSLRDFDDKITAYYCGFQGAADYYARAAASKVVDRIAVPTFILHAANDPFIRILPETRDKIRTNPNIRFLETEDGGHCSFLDAPLDGYDGHWAERQIIDFCRRVQRK